MEKPEIKIPLSHTDKVLQIIGGLVILFLWVLTVLFFIKMPKVIPIQFDALGKVNGYGRKEIIFFLPALATVLFTVFYYLSRVPHFFNYAVVITGENALRQYTNSARTMRVMGISIGLIMIVIVFSIQRAANGQGSLFGPWMLPVVVSIILLPTLYYIIRSIRTK
jgi:hypothetical protein